MAFQGLYCTDFQPLPGNQNNSKSVWYPHKPCCALETRSGSHYSPIWWTPLLPSHWSDAREQRGEGTGPAACVLRGHAFNDTCLAALNSTLPRSLRHLFKRGGTSSLGFSSQSVLCLQSLSDLWGGFHEREINCKTGLESLLIASVVISVPIIPTLKGQIINIAPWHSRELPSNLLNTLCLFSFQAFFVQSHDKYNK